MVVELDSESDEEGIELMNGYDLQFVDWLIRTFINLADFSLFNQSDAILKFESNGGCSDDSITLYSSDLKCLEEREFLNDTIIGFYLL